MSVIIALGDKARDHITGLEGIVVGRCVYISGCDQVLLAPGIGTDGSYRESHWFDVDRCHVTQHGAVTVASVSSAARPGGDVPAPAK